MSDSSRWADAAAVALSALCLLHCLAMPVLAGLLPVLAATQGGGWMHWAFVCLAAPAAAIALRGGRGADRAFEAGLRASAGCGVALLAWGATHWPVPGWGTPLTVAGALVLAGVHLINTLTLHPPGPHAH